MRSFSNLNCWSKTNTRPSPDKYVKVRSGSFPCKCANEATTSYLHAIKTDLRNRVPLRKPCFQGICKTKCYPRNRNFRFGLFLQNKILFSRCDFWSYSCKNRLTRSYSCKQEVKIPIQLLPFYIGKILNKWHFYLKIMLNKWHFYNRIMVNRWKIYKRYKEVIICLEGWWYF